MMIRARTPRTRAAVCACPKRPSVNSYVLSQIELHLPEQCDGIETDDTNLGFSIIAVQCEKSIVISPQWKSSGYALLDGLESVLDSEGARGSGDRGSDDPRLRKLRRNAANLLCYCTLSPSAYPLRTQECRLESS